MSTLLTNIATFISMIFQVIVAPNTGASDERYSLFVWLFNLQSGTSDVIRSVLLLTFGIMLTGVSIGILRRFLWKN